VREPGTLAFLAFFFFGVITENRPGNFLASIIVLISESQFLMKAKNRIKRNTATE